MHTSKRSAPCVQRLVRLCMISVFAALSACAPSERILRGSSESVDTSSARGLNGSQALTSQPEEGQASASADANAQDARTQRSESVEQTRCDRPQTNLRPLSAPDDTPIYEQFNFQPQRISASSTKVTIDTSYHIFSYCQKTGEWTITNRPPAEASPFSYKQYLQDLSDPKYEKVEIAGQNYAYRIRLEAPWLDQQIPEQIEEQNQKQAPATASAAQIIEASRVETPEIEQADQDSLGDETVYFDIKSPTGEINSHELYTLEDVQSASIGASLGVPSIVDVAETQNATWFAATTSQGEGENGFASLLRYDHETQQLNIHQPAAIQGDQITSLATTFSDNTLTFWLGTLRSAEGSPALPASGLVSYRPTSDNSGTLEAYTAVSSPLEGAIPYQLSVVEDSLWIATGSGVCQTQWRSIAQDDSWRCWRFTASAALPSEGVDLYRSFLAEEPATQLEGANVEVLWANWEHFNQPDVDKRGSFRYEVDYAPGFEAELAQGGYRVDSKVAQRMAGSRISWPGQPWHWGGQRFERSLDEVPLNLLGGGPRGLMASSIQVGRSFDYYAIRGGFDLLSLKPNGTRIRYYSGWVEGKDIEAYPTIVEVEPSEAAAPNPILAILSDLPPVGP